MKDNSQKNVDEQYIQMQINKIVWQNFKYAKKKPNPPMTIKWKSTDIIHMYYHGYNEQNFSKQTFH